MLCRGHEFFAVDVEMCVVYFMTQHAPATHGTIETDFMCMYAGEEK